jgi:hypothetical protein
MTRTIDGHPVNIRPCDGLRHHYRVHAGGVFVGLLAYNDAGWHAMPVREPGRGCGPVCHSATLTPALATLLAERYR